MQKFLSVLSLCHTVIPAVRDDGEIVYKAASPDEGALVDAAKCFGYKYAEKSMTTMTVDENGAKAEYEVLATNEFSSKRKRMSILVRRPDGRTFLYLKGTDSVVAKRLTKHARGDARYEVARRTMRQLSAFAAEGLRTLLVAEREVAAPELDEWLAKYREAQTAISGRDALLEAAAEEVEQSLELVGATAIEDRLQDGVPEAIESLAAAGCKIWMLTGDKEETAVNIGRSCCILANHMRVLVLTEPNRVDCIDDMYAKIDRLKDEKQRRKAEHDIRVKKGEADAGDWDPDGIQNDLALVIDGAALQNLLCSHAQPSEDEEKVQLELIALAQQCKAARL